MAKFCGNCGFKLDDNAKVCSQCNTRLDEIPEKRVGLKTVDREKLQRLKKKVKIFLILGIIVFLAIIAVNIASNFMGHKGLLRKVMAAYEEYDIDTLISLSSDMYYYSEDNFVDYYFENNVGEDLDSFEASVGHSYSLTYKVNETYRLSDRKLDVLLDNIEITSPDFDTNIIKQVIIAEITVTAKQGSKSTDRELQVIMTKEGKSWKLLYIGRKNV